LREVSFGSDGSYSAEAIVTRTNAELANSFGNLAQRTLSMIHKNLEGKLPALGDKAEDMELRGLVLRACAEELPKEFERLAFSQGIEAWIKAVFACNQYVDAMAPWGLKKTDPDRMAEVLGTLYYCIRDLAIAISPVIPASVTILLDHMGITVEERDKVSLSDQQWYQELSQSDFILEKPKPIFPRLEMPEAEGDS